MVCVKSSEYFSISILFLNKASFLHFDESSNREFQVLISWSLSVWVILNFVALGLFIVVSYNRSTLPADTSTFLIEFIHFKLYLLFNSLKCMLYKVFGNFCIIPDNQYPTILDLIVISIGCLPSSACNM